MTHGGVDKGWIRRVRHDGAPDKQRVFRAGARLSQPQRFHIGGALRDIHIALDGPNAAAGTAARRQTNAWRRGVPGLLRSRNQHEL